MKSKPDIAALISFAAGGGLAGIFIGLGYVFPAHKDEFTNAGLAIVAVCTSLAGIIRTLANPSAPAGTVSANIPIGSIPVVAAAPGTNQQSVAVADPNIVLGVTAATVAPPKQEAPPSGGKE